MGKVKIGLLGGTSYPSTMLYYNRLNELYQKKFSGFHSCPIILYSIDYHDIKSLYPENWQEISQILKNELLELASMTPACIVICNNTLHKAYDLIKDELNLAIPILHCVELCLEYLIKEDIKEVLLLATKFTMEDDFFKKYLEENLIKIQIPTEEERIKIQAIQTELAKGKIDNDSLEFFQELTNKYRHLPAHILACTELPMLYPFIETEVKIINTIELQCQKAMDFF